MTRKDFVSLADALREEVRFLDDREDNHDLTEDEAILCRQVVANIAGRIADRLSADNPAFDRRRFMDAIGLLIVRDDPR